MTRPGSVGIQKLNWDAIGHKSILNSDVVDGGNPRTD